MYLRDTVHHPPIPGTLPPATLQLTHFQYDHISVKTVLREQTSTVYHLASIFTLSVYLRNHKREHFL